MEIGGNQKYSLSLMARSWKQKRSRATLCMSQKEFVLTVKDLGLSGKICLKSDRREGVEMFVPKMRTVHNGDFFFAILQVCYQC